MTDKILVATSTSTSLVVPGTGEQFDLAVAADAARAIRAIEEYEAMLASAKEAAKLRLIEESRVQGTKTLRYGDAVVEISGGPGATGIDCDILRRELEKAGCPSERIEEAIRTEVEEKANRSVCKQLAGANEAYRRAVEAATYTFEKRYGVRVG